MKWYLTRIIFALLLFLCRAEFASGQDSSSVKFYDVITEDSIVMYFNDSYNFTEQGCAGFKRYTRVDSNGIFSGSFIDSGRRGNVMGRGFYHDAAKQGYFEIFHSNGQLKSKGNFKANRPSGYWDTYYANGKPERRILFNVADTLLIDFYDSDGVQLVKAGNGHFKGLVGSAVDDLFSMLIQAEGEIVNGKPDGEWKTKLAANAHVTEKYAGGRFLSGVFPKGLVNDGKQYNDFSYLDIIYMPSYIYRLEAFISAKCYDFTSNLKAVDKKPAPSGNYSLNNVRSFINDAINRAIETDARNGNLRDYQTGDNLLKIRFKVNEQGVPMDFKQVTSWGDQFFYGITTALSMHAKLPPSADLQYLVITIIKSESSTISYNYRFSID